MPNDQPIAHTADGRPIYDNTPTVVCVIVENHKGQILAVRRANDPGKGLLGLPGGFQMRETWQEAGVREVKEEADISLGAESLSLLSMETDEYGNNLVIARHTFPVRQLGYPLDGEALELMWLDANDIKPDQWAFPRHLSAVESYCEFHRLVNPRLGID